MLSHTPGFNVKVSRMSIGHSWGTTVKRSHVIKKKRSLAYQEKQFRSWISFILYCISIYEI